MSVANKITLVDFKCMICEEIIAFNIEDQSSYQSKTYLEDFFYMKLFRYVVSHTSQEEEHVNVVIVDQNGKYRGHKDAYISKPSISITYSNYKSITDQLINHKFIELFFIVNQSIQTIMEYVNEIHIKTASMTEKILSFLEESKEIYEILPSELVFSYANKNFYIYLLNGSYFGCASFSDKIDVQKELIGKLLSNFNAKINESFVNTPLQKLFLLILKISNIDTFNKNDLVYIQKLLSSDKFFSELQINPSYKENVQILKKNFVEEFPCADHILNELIDQKVSLIAIFAENLTSYKCVIDFIEYLERRKVFLF